MNEILELVAPQHAEWVASLGPKGIANMLNTIAVIPFMKHKAINKVDRAVNIGKLGEASFENIISKTMSNSYKLVNNAKKSHAGDFHISWQSPDTNQTYTILVDVKNYKSSVPTKEVDKLYRDLNENNVNAGLMISLGSKITGFSRSITIKYVYLNNGKKIPVIFASVSTPDVICEIIKLIFHVVNVNLFDSSIDSVDMDGLFNQVNSLSDSVQLMMNTRNLLIDSKNRIDADLNKILYELMACEFSLTSKINSINKTLVSKQDELKLVEPCESTPISMINNIKSMFKIDEEMLPLLHSIFNIGWDSSHVNIPKRHWVLLKNDKQIILKILKDTICMTIPVLESTMQPFINTVKKINTKLLRNTKAGIYIKITNDTIEHVIKILECV